MGEHTFSSLQLTIDSLIITSKSYISLCKDLENTFKSLKSSFSSLSSTNLPLSSKLVYYLSKSFKTKQDQASKYLTFISHWEGIFLSKSKSLKSFKSQIRYEKSLYKLHEKLGNFPTYNIPKSFTDLESTINDQKSSFPQLIDTFIKEFLKLDSPLPPLSSRLNSAITDKPKAFPQNSRSSSVSTLRHSKLI